VDISDIAGYKVVRQLGAGGMGQVFLVQHPRLPRQDALKLLDSGVSRNDDFKARFQREADLLAQLYHPNIVTLHDRGEFEDRLFITMEYVDGTDAGELLKTSGALEPQLALALVAGAGAALDYAWRKQRITHRDVKPANILIAMDGEQVEAVKLADFGIAKAAGEATSLTSTGITVGTMAYISPEAIEDKDLDNRADIYSLGCTAFHLLTGQPPYTAKSMTGLMSAHLNHEVPSVSTVAPHLPEALDGVFAKVLAKNPDDRYRSCGEFVAALREAVGDAGAADPAFANTALAAAMPTVIRTVPASETGASKSRTRIGLAAVVAALVIAAGVLGVVLVKRGGGEKAVSAVAPTGTVTTTVSAPRTTSSAIERTTSGTPATTTEAEAETTTTEPTTSSGIETTTDQPTTTISATVTASTLPHGKPVAGGQCSLGDHAPGLACDVENGMWLTSGLGLAVKGTRCPAAGDVTIGGNEGEYRCRMTSSGLVWGPLN
jgi:serine/threonine protein kinase